MSLIDLHAHFPMHTKFPPRVNSDGSAVGKELEFFAANLLLNFAAGQPRVSLTELEAGSPGGTGSVLYDPDDEFFRDAKPRPQAFQNLLAQIGNVESEIAASHGAVEVARNPADVKRFFDTKQRFLFHCMEGAFAFGGDPANVAVAASRGVAYVIVAHLFFRGVATCANAFPFLPDELFEQLNPEQDDQTGLTPLGQDIVGEIFRNRMLVDVTHCTDRARADIFGIARKFPGAPVISSHNGVQHESKYPLNLSDDAIRQIADTGGVVGVILYPHWLRQPDEQIFGADGFPVLFKTIEHIADVTSFDHVAIGTDLDGFIKPVKGCETYAQTPALAAAIQARFPGDADKILFRNALRVLNAGWKGV
jgi:microsomal dipeptidase-like Zn-dependent dipeptidase